MTSQTKVNSELERYLELTTKSRSMWEEAKEYLPGGDSRNAIFWQPYPIFLDSSQGCRVQDVDGVERIDFVNSMTTLILGHGHPAVVKAIQQQAARGLVYNAPNPYQVRLARLLCQRISSLELVRFTNSGTEATMNTLRAARAFTGRDKIAKCEGGYHGTHDLASVSVRVDPKLAGDARRPKAVASSEGIPKEVVGQIVVIPFNDTEASQEILEGHKDQLAAVIVEPVLGTAGMVPADAEYLAMLREFTQRNGIVLIFDEVISLRVAPGGAQEHYDITPDMTSLGKIIGGGFPIGAFGGRREIMELYDPTEGARVVHAGTFNANPITMLAGAVTMEQLTPETYHSLAALTERLQGGVRQVCAGLEVPVQVTGLGSLFGIHFTARPIRTYRDLLTRDQDLCQRVFWGLMNEGILIATNLVGALSTAIGEREVDTFLDSFHRVLKRQG